MSDTPTQKNDDATASDEAASPLAGQRLAEARRSNDISIAEIAKELHLDEPKVQALEENQFDVLGAPVFAKGHLKKYATLVGVPVDDVLADYYQLNRAAGAPPVVGPKRPTLPRDIALGPWIAGGIALAILAGGIYWWMNRDPSSEAAQSASDTTGVLEPYAADRVSGTDRLSDDTADTPLLGTTNGDTDAESAEPLPETEGPVESARSGVAQEAAFDVINGDGEGVRLVMTFTGDCWSEVTDANGDRLFFGLGQAGQTITRNGMPPLHALFGDHANVSITVDGVDFPLRGGSGSRGNTATVTINP